MTIKLLRKHTMKRNHILSLLASTLLASSAVAGGSGCFSTMNYDAFKGTSLSNKKPGTKVTLSKPMYGVDFSLDATSVTEGVLYTYLQRSYRLTE